MSNDLLCIAPIETARFVKAGFMVMVSVRVVEGVAQESAGGVGVEQRGYGVPAKRKTKTSV